MTSTPKPNRSPLSAHEERELNTESHRIWGNVCYVNKRWQRKPEAHFAQLAADIASLKIHGLWKRLYILEDGGPLASWSAFCDHSMPFPRRYMDRQCKVAEVYTALTVATFDKPEYAMLKPAEIAWLPTHEKHCEALALFPSDEWVGIWERVKATDRRITEALIKAMGQSVAGFYDAHRNAQEPYSAFSGVVGYTPT